MRILTNKTIYLITIIAILINSNLFGKLLLDEEIENISIMDLEGIYYFLIALFLCIIIIFIIIYNSLKSYINRKQYVSNYEWMERKVRDLERSMQPMNYHKPQAPGSIIDDYEPGSSFPAQRGYYSNLQQALDTNSNEEADSFENINDHPLSQSPTISYFYADLPEPGSYFLESKLTNEETPFSIYRFGFNNLQPNIMQLEFINKIDLYPKLYRIRNQVLKPACDYNDPVSEIRNIGVIQPGVVSKEGDRWRITSKIQLEIN